MSRRKPSRVPPDRMTAVPRGYAGPTMPIKERFAHGVTAEVDLTCDACDERLVQFVLDEGEIGWREGSVRRLLVRDEAGRPVDIRLPCRCGKPSDVSVQAVEVLMAGLARMGKPRARVSVASLNAANG